MFDPHVYVAFRAPNTGIAVKLESLEALRKKLKARRAPAGFSSGSPPDRVGFVQETLSEMLTGGVLVLYVPFIVLVGLYKRLQKSTRRATQRIPCSSSVG